MTIEAIAVLHESGAPGDDSTDTANRLTAREAEVVRYLASGATAREIGGTLRISPRTVESHVFNAYRKLGVHSRVQLIRLLMEQDLLGG